MQLHHVDWNSISWEPVRTEADRKPFAGDSGTLAQHRPSPRRESKLHQHPNEQIVYILSGQIRFHVRDEDEPVLLGAVGSGGGSAEPPCIGATSLATRPC